MPGSGAPGHQDILIVADAGYDGPRLAWLQRDLPIQVLTRMRSDRVLRRAAPPWVPTVLLEGFVQRDEALLEPEDGRLGTVGEVQLGEDTRHVRLDRLLGDGEGTGDLPVGPAAGQ